MKFMLMMNTPKGPYQIASWPPKAIGAHIQFMKDMGEKLSSRGELVGGEGLAAPDQARLVRAGKDGKPVTDGPFAETKEFLAGYWIVDVDDAARAHEIAAEISLAPGKDGEPLYLGIEVRQVMSPPPSEYKG